MMNNVMAIFKTIAIACVLIVVFLSILLVLDVFSATETKDALVKVLEVSGILAAGSVVVVVINNFSKK